jgi:hypothetical protein
MPLAEGSAAPAPPPATASGSHSLGAAATGLSTPGALHFHLSLVDFVAARREQRIEVFAAKRKIRYPLVWCGNDATYSPAWSQT